MNMSIVFPLPNSPTTRDYPCELDVKNVFMGVFTLIICLCGMAGNGAVLSLLGFSSHSKPITVYIFHMAIIDLVFLLLIFIYTLLYLLKNGFCFPAMTEKYEMLLDQLCLFFYILGLYLLTAISFNRCRSIFCPLRCHCQRSQHQSMVVSAMQGAISIAVIPTLTSLFQSTEIEVYFVCVTFMYVVSLLFLASSMVMSSASLFIKAKCGSKQQKQHKRLDIIIFFMVLFALPPSFCDLLYMHIDSISTDVYFLLACIHSTIKPFIYLSVGSCGRPCSMGSPQLSLLSILGESEENTVSSNDGTMDTVV